MVLAVARSTKDEEESAGQGNGRVAVPNARKAASANNPDGAALDQVARLPAMNAATLDTAPNESPKTQTTAKSI